MIHHYLARSYRVLLQNAATLSPSLLPSSAWRQASPCALASRAGLSVRRVLEPHRSSYPDTAACRAFVSSFDQLRIGDPLALRGGEQCIDTITFLGITAIIAPRELVQIAVDVLGANPMVNTKDLPLEVRPCALQSVDVAEVDADVSPRLWLTVW